MRARSVDQFRLPIKQRPDSANIAGRRRAPDAHLGEPRLVAQHLMRTGVKRAVVEVRIVVAKARGLHKLIRQFPVRRLHCRLQLRPPVETPFSRQHQVAIGQPWLDRTELLIGKSAVLRVRGANSCDGFGPAAAPRFLQRLGLFLQIFERRICG